MNLWRSGRQLISQISLAACFCLLSLPAVAQEYQVSVSLLGDSTIPAPLSYTFDTTTPFQTSGDVSYSNLSVAFDSQCGSDCSVDGVSYNANGSEISYSDQGVWFAWSIGCSVFFGSGSCTVNPIANVSQVGVVYGSFLSGGTIVVNQLSSGQGNSDPSVPEGSSYLELAGLGLSLVFLARSRLGIPLLRRYRNAGVW